MAAVLACGSGALLSHRSAAALWELLPDQRAVIDVTAPGRSRVGHSGVVVHRPRRLADDDRAVLHGIPVTSIPRTLLDLAEVAPRQLERAFEEAERLRLLDMRAVSELCERSRGRHGLKPLSHLIERRHDPPPATRSELERRFLDLCREAGLPRPRVNVVVAGHEVDMAWPDRRLVVELDGHAYHHTRMAFERDRVRDAALQLAGYRVLRVTHRRLANDPRAVAETVRRLLAAV